MFKLICLPLGANAAPLFYQEASGLPFKETMMVTSSRHLVQEGRRQGLNTVNFDYLVHHIIREAAPQKKRLVSRTAQELIVSELAADLQTAGKLPYFAPVVDKTGFLRSLLVLLNQLESSNASSQEVNLALAAWDGREVSRREKDKEVALLYESYRNYLDQKNLYDVAGMYQLALSLVRQQKVTFPCCSLYFYGFYNFDSLQLELIKALSDKCRVTVGLVYEPNRPGIFAASEDTYGFLAALGENVRLDSKVQKNILTIEKNSSVGKNPAVKRTPPLEYLLANLRQDRPQVYQQPQDKIRVWKALDRREEIGLVLRDIKKLMFKGVAGSEVAVIVRNLEGYTGFRRSCDQLGIPTVLPQTVGLLSTPLWEYVQAFFKTALGFGRQQTLSLIDFLSLPLQKLLLQLPADKLAALGKNLYFKKGEAFCRQAEALLVPETVASWKQIQQLLAQIPQQADLQEYSDLLTTLLDFLKLPERVGSLYRQHDLSLISLKSLLGADESLRQEVMLLQQAYDVSGLTIRKIALADYLQLLQKQAQAQTLTLQPGSTVGIRILSATEMENLSFPYVYLLGLRENEFPILKSENWLYDDQERLVLRDLGLDLPGALAGYAEDARFFASACAAASVTLTCSYSENERQGASPYIEDLLAVFGEDCRKSRSLSDVGTELASWGEYYACLAQKQDKKQLAKLLGQDFVRAADADNKRLQQIDCLWNGQLLDPELRLQSLDVIGDHFSPSKLESYLICPFKFLHNYVWKQAGDVEAAENIRPDVKGSLMHAVLEKFIGRHLKEKLLPEEVPELRRELEQLLTSCSQDFMARGQIVDGEFWQADCLQLQRLLCRWLQSEISYSQEWNFRPYAVESSFGRRRDLQPALILPLGKRKVSINGRIDRVDRNLHQYFITDYKSSVAPALNSLAKTNLQLPLYLWAAQENLLRTDAEAQVDGGGYYVLREASRKGNFVYADYRNEIPFAAKAGKNTAQYASLKDLQEQVLQIVQQEIISMEQGKFTPAYSAKNCNIYCPAHDLCRIQILQQEQEAGEQDE